MQHRFAMKLTRAAREMGVHTAIEPTATTATG